MKEKLAINLLVDDTVIYMNKRGRYDEVLKVLDRWCEVSGAKFNKEKIEIIPIGTKALRNTIIQTRKLHPED